LVSSAMLSSHVSRLTSYESQCPGEDRPRSISLQIGVEGHRQVPQEDAAEGSRADLLVRELDQAVGGARLEGRQGLGEGLVESDSELFLDLALDDHTVTEQIADDGSPHPVVLRESKPAKGRGALARDRFAVGGKLPAVLDIGASYRPNRAHSESDQVCACLRR